MRVARTPMKMVESTTMPYSTPTGQVSSGPLGLGVPKNAPGAESTILLEFPIAADVYANDVENPSAETVSSATTIQGGALRTYPFDPRPARATPRRIVNTAPVEFPMTAAVVPHSIDDKMASGAFDGDVVIGGDIGW
ncbi:hypothetical protein JL721_11339 [Aureococcus anophagefferens]|nr:hypothetical protein JL721_11339 [Aureococcus anophagefferens]